MGIAAGVGAHRPALRTSLMHAVRAHLDRASSTDVTARSGCFSNEYRQQPLRVEVLDPER